MELLRQSLRDTCTVDDVEIDSYGTILKNEDWNADISNADFESEIRNTLTEFKSNFCADIQEVTGGDFIVSAEISGKVPRNTGMQQK